MKQVVLSLLAVFFFGASAVSQVRHLSLEQSVEIAKKQSYTMQKLEQDLKITEYNLQSATRKLKTHIDLNLTLPNYTKTIRQWEDSSGVTFYPVEQLSYSSNLTIEQPLLSNGSLYIQTDLAAFEDFNTDFRSTNLKTRVGFNQPLDAFYGYNTIKSTLKRAELAYEKTSKYLKRSELSLVYRVSNSYYNLLALQKSREFAQLDLERQTEAYEISRKKHEAGLIREVDALQMEVDLAEAQNSYDIAVLEQISATNSFKELLGIELSDSIVLSNELHYEVVVVDPDRAVHLAMENRLDIREQDIDIALQEMDVKRQKSEGMIKANVNAYFEKAGVSREDINNVGLGSAIDFSFQDYRNRPANYGIGLTIRIPILDWGENKSLVRASQSRLKQLTLEKEEFLREIEVSVRNLVSEISSNLKRMRLLEKNVGVAEKSFEITLSRYSDGDIDSQALALERNRLNNAYRSHLSAYIKYQLSLVDLMQQTVYDFREETPVR